MRILLLTILILTCGSCAFFRYHSALVNKPDRRIRNVAVLIALDQYASGTIAERVRFRVTKAVAEELSDLNGFNFKILERDISLARIVNFKNSDLAFELRGRYDAYITIGAKNRYTHKVTIEMRETNANGALLIESQYSGKGSMEDDVRRTIDLFAKQWRRLQAANSPSVF